MTSTWYVSYEIRNTGTGPKRRNFRKTLTFATETQAKTFAREKVEEGLMVFAGTINPYSPKRLIVSSSIHDWLDHE